MKYYLAIDIGASSGRHIIGWQKNGVIHMDEVYRFANGTVNHDSGLVWDVEHIFSEVQNGIIAALTKYHAIESLSIDTWAVDYVLMRGNEPVMPCYAYRDGRTATVIDKVHELVPFAEFYEHTGIQFQPFNTIYQLYADKLAGRLDGVTDFLMLPEYLMWRLMGVKIKEYTNATTTGLVNAYTRQYDREIIERLGLPQGLFGELSMPGTVVGNALDSSVRMVLCATHDTASAVEGIPMEDDALFLSSGTWSLLGVKLPAPLTDVRSRASNFTNEGGCGYYLYRKNIMGLWIIQCLQKQIGRSFEKMATMACESTYVKLFDVNELRFSAPLDMRGEILSALGEVELSDSSIINSIYHSLADSYRQTIVELERNSSKTWDKLYIVGGGAKNGYLIELTRQYTNKEVIALPIEATALGNLKIQMIVGVGL